VRRDAEADRRKVAVAWFTPRKTWNRVNPRGLFAPLLRAIYYASLVKIVGRHFKLYAIANRKTNESLPHFPT
jgi:hypothetical protein